MPAPAPRGHHRRHQGAVAELKVIGADIDGYEDKVATVAEAGIIDGTTVQDVVRELTDKWGVTDRL